MSSPRNSNPLSSLDHSSRPIHPPPHPNETLYPRNTSRHSNSAVRAPEVAILLCSYNGARFLREQLDSIQAQSHKNWKLWVSDDGSSDTTLTILMEYRQKWGPHKLEIVRGPRKGFVANFLTLVCRPTLQAHYFSYADQDDIWKADKLTRALAQLKAYPEHRPALYCSRTRLVDASGSMLGFSPLFSRPPNFRNALVQNIGSGNTMVFNATARHVLVSVGPDLNVFAHDWWTYLAISAVDGKIYYDPQPSLLYRQHHENLIGVKQGLGSIFMRVQRLLRGHIKNSLNANAAGIQRLVPQLSSPNWQIFLQFQAARQGGVIKRLLALKRARVYRQTWIGNLSLIMAVFFKKL